MTKLEAVAYVHACEFMRAVKFSTTTWKEDAENDPHLAEALRILGILGILGIDSTEEVS